MRVFRPQDFGADPTGEADSSAAFDALLAAMWADAKPRDPATDPRFPHTADLGGAVIDLAGGEYRVDRPVVIPSAAGGCNFALLDGTLRAGKGFPKDRFVLELNVSSSSWPSLTVEDVTLSDLVIDANDAAAGCLSCVNCDHVVVDRCWLANFLSFGYYALNGHENYLSNSWVSQRTADLNGTGLFMGSADSSVVDTVVYNTKLGFWVTAGNSIIENVHVFNSGHHAYGDPENDPLWPFGGGYVQARGVRLVGVYFDDCTLVLHNPQHVTVTDGLWLLGEWTERACVVLQPEASAKFNKPPELKGLVLRDNYVRTAASFNASRYNGSTFLLVDTRPGPGAFNGTAMSHVSVGNNDLSELDSLRAAGLSFTVRGTEARKAAAKADATSWEFDFSDCMLFPAQLDYVAVTVAERAATRQTNAGASAAGGSLPPPLQHSVLVRGSVVEVVTSRPASALVSVEVRQGHAPPGTDCIN